VRLAGKPLWPLLGAAALWLPLGARWSRAWSVAPDQAFGWGVPVLAVYLFAVRWGRLRNARSVPLHEPPDEVGLANYIPGETAPSCPTGSIALRSGTLRAFRFRVWALLAFIVGCLLVLTDLPVLEANALWPTAQWWGAAGAVLATLGALTWAGGPAWALQFAFPPLFLFTALTLPTPIKSWMVGSLSGANAQIAAAIVSVAGHPAVVSGNVIAVSTGLVGIEEACSGLRSLQTVWMIAWFGGEFFLLNLPRRLFLVFISLLVALAANLGRTIFLTWMAAAVGLGASESWHDRAGNIELAIDLVVIAALAWRGHRGQWKRRLVEDPERSRRVASEGREKRRAVEDPERSRGTASLRRTVEDPERSRRVASILLRLRPFAVAAILVGLTAEVGTRAWYRLHARSAQETLVHWRLQAPSAGWKPEPVPARETQVLQSTSAAGLSVRPPVSDFAAWVFVVSWEGDAARSENPEWHDPAICLPASGGRLTASLATAAVPIGSLVLQFAGYRFDESGRTETVYFCHWDAETARARVESNGSAGDVRARRWQRVEEGRRQGDVAHLAFVIETANSDAALEWLRKWAPLLLRPVAG